MEPFCSILHKNLDEVISVIGSVVDENEENVGDLFFCLKLIQWGDTAETLDIMQMMYV
jgi:hypothetical protein